MRQILRKQLMRILRWMVGAPPGGLTPLGTPDVQRSDEEWRELLTPDQYRILRQAGTERAFTGAYWNHKDSGAYHCAGCGQALFDSRSKFDSGTGWPSFWQAVDAQSVVLKPDHTLGMRRVEVLCARCHSHLGHLFDDGPPPSGQRYCINSACLRFESEQKS